MTTPIQDDLQSEPAPVANAPVSAPPAAAAVATTDDADADFFHIPDDEFDRLYEEFKAERAREALEAAARKHQPRPVVPIAIQTITLAENHTPEVVAETLVRFYGVARARQIREGLVNTLRVFKNRKSATWDLVQEDFIEPIPWNE